MRHPIALCVVALLAASSLTANAQVAVNINVPGLITIAPPAPRYEPQPSPRPSQVWVPGHWQWVNETYAWRRGHWVAARPDYAYTPGRWVQAHGGWRWVEGDWRPGRKDHKHHRHEDDEGHGDHCPPGQAKKGRC